MPTVCIAGTFDVENYGDCLFPIIAQHRLAAAGHNVVAVSPTSTPTRWQDSLRPIAVSALLDPQLELAGALIGGGNIIHNHADKLSTYVDAGVGETAYASLWCGVTLACSLRGVPVAWNAPGVTRPFRLRELQTLVPAITNLAGYKSVRDEASRNHLGSRSGSEFRIVPDTAVELSSAWPKSSLEPVLDDLLARKSYKGDRNFFTVHAKGRSIDTDIKSLAVLIDQFAEKTGLTPILVALAPCHLDDQTARELSACLNREHVLLDDADKLAEIAAVIAFARAHIGASLHGYITSYSYNVPSALVARPNLKKFQGFTEQVGRAGDIVSTWQQAFDQVGQRLDTPPRDLDTDSRLQQQIDEHWARIAALFLSPSAPNHHDTMLKLLQPMISWSGESKRKSLVGKIAGRLRKIAQGQR